MDSRTFQAYPVPGGGPNTAWSYYWTALPTPWLFNGDHLTVEGDFRLKIFSQQGNAVGQLNIVFYFDAKTQSGSPKRFALVANIADTRGSVSDAIGNDTYYSFAGTGISNSSDFLEIDNSSHSQTSSAWTGLRKYKFHITWGNMQDLIEQLNSEENANLSTNRYDYELSDIHVLSELKVLSPYAGDVQIGYSFKNIKVRTCSNLSCN